MGAVIWALCTILGAIATLFLFAVGFDWMSFLGMVLFWAIAGFLNQNLERYDATENRTKS